MMDASTLTLHRNLLRLAKGALKSYAEWVDEQAVSTMADTLKRERAQLTPPGDCTPPP